MYSVFSNYLIWRQRLAKSVPQETTSIVEVLRDIERNPIYEPQLLLPPESPDEVVVNDDTYVLCVKPSMHKIIEWASKEILAKLLTDSYKTRMVKLRIVAGMLNNAENAGDITEEQNYWFHDNLVKNTHCLNYDMTCESLPFLTKRLQTSSLTRTCSSVG